MNYKQKVYLAGQPDKYENNWKSVFKKIPDFDFFDWEIDSNQDSPDTFFPEDLQAVHNADILIANPGVAPSEATWFEIGAFYMKNTIPGNFCKNLIIIWKEDRNPKWSIEFIKKAGIVVNNVEEAIQKLTLLNK